MIRIRFLKLGYINDKHKDTVYVLFIDRVSSVKECFSKKFLEDYRTLINIIINLNLYLKLHHATDALRTFSSTNQLPGFYKSGTFPSPNIRNIER